MPRKFLNDDEELLVEMRPHWVFFARPLFTAVVVVAGIIALLVAFPSMPNWATDVLLVLMAIPVLWLIGRLLRWRAYTLALTTTRIVVRRGVFGRNTTQIRLQRITEIALSQKLWERVISAGRLLIDVQGEDDAIVIEFVRKPAIVQRVINGQINEICGGGSAEPIPLELLGHRRSWAPPEPECPSDYEHTSATRARPERANDTPPFGVPVVPAQADPWAASGPPTAPSARSRSRSRSEARRRRRRRHAAAADDGRPRSDRCGRPRWPGEIRDRLIELDELRQRKIISEEEFAAKKAELLSRI